MSNKNVPVLKQQFCDDNGDPLSGGFLYSYESNSLIPKATYTDRTGGTANTNPVVLDSGGRADVWGSGLYKFVVTDSNGVVLYTCAEIYIDPPDGSAADAAASASAAAISASAASTSATNAASSASAASTSASGASTSASTATTQASNASTSASTASTQATNAASSASAASTSASGAATSATNAATSATSAATSATSAASSATAAAASATSASSAATDTTPSITGSRASPQSITAAGGVAFSGTKWFSTWYVQGSGGAIDITKNPQVAAGTNVGQRLRIIGRHDTNTLQFDDGTGLDLNGSAILGASHSLDLEWDGTNWIEVGRTAR